jgi:hypothetical protein
LTLPWLIRATAKAVGGSKLVEVPRSGHGPGQEQSEIYTALLLDFLTTIDQKRRDAKFKPPKWSLVEYFHSVNGNSRA